MCAIGLLSVGTVFASVIRYANLGPGETTPDGSLTFVTYASARGTAVSLRNNGLRPIVVDSYELTGGDAHNCSGRRIPIESNRMQALCKVTAENAPGSMSARASLLLSISWHPLQPRPLSSPAASVTVAPYHT